MIDAGPVPVLKPFVRLRVAFSFGQMLIAGGVGMPQVNLLIYGPRGSWHAGYIMCMVGCP